MQAQASKICFSLFVVLSLLANHSISADSSEQYAPTASESQIKSASWESYLSVPPSANIPDVVSESNGTLPAENVSTLSNSIETSDEGSFTQENQSPPPSNTVSETPENVPQLNDYSSLPIAAAPAPSEALSYPELNPTIQSTPSNDETYDSAPTSNQHTILPSNYRAEDEAVEPYEEKEDSWNRANGAVACVLVGACVVGVGGFVYQKKKKDDVRAQVQREYECLALVKKEGV